MTTFDQMAASDPVGAAACRDAGRFDGQTVASQAPPERIALDRHYTGIPRVGGGPGVVEVWEGDIRLGRLEHRVVRHSPDGFSWGYCGSGCAELALNLIIDALGQEAWCAHCGGTGSVTEVDGGGEEYLGRCARCRGERLGPLAQPIIYQAFKREVVADWPTDAPWRISRAEIIAWIRREVSGT